MKILVGLISYIAAVVAIVIGTAVGGAWLLRPELGMKVAAKPRAIPQKILESIERKKASGAEIATPILTKPEMPAMREVPVSLTQRPVPRQVIREAAPPSAAKDRRKIKALYPPVARLPAEGPRAPVPPRAVRNDFPY